jgi:RNA polymerase sigma factor for flagellar operon FliA
MIKLTLGRDSDQGGCAGTRAASDGHSAGAQQQPNVGLAAAHDGSSTSDAAERRVQLVLRYEPLVRSVAGRVGLRVPAHVELADLIQAGVFGLLDAIDRFEPGMGIRFEAYAVARIRGAILDELRAQDWVPRSVRNRMRELASARESVEARLGRHATAAELAAELGIGRAEVKSVLGQIQVLSLEALDEWTASRDGTVTVAEMSASSESDPEVIVETRETGKLLTLSLAKLPERDRRILRMYYTEGLTLAQIGVRLGVTESRVSQLRSRAITRLRIQFAELAGISVPAR